MSSIFEKIGIKKQQRQESKSASKKSAGSSVSNRKKAFSKKKINKGQKKLSKKDKTSLETSKSLKVKNSKFQKNKKNPLKAYKFLLEVVDTEKSAEDKQKGKYTFRVSKKSNKNQIRKSIQDYYLVEVDNVNIINYKPKKKRFGLTWGKRIAWKKAIVSLKEGYFINL